MSGWTVEGLRLFEEEIAGLFNAGSIRAPVHLEGGNEAELIKIFREVGPEDWVCCTWRSHLKALLKGVPADRLKAELLAGRSIAACVPEHRVISSAIVGGMLPVAVGLAWEIKRRGGSERVWCFVGDMAAMTGIFHECEIYAECNDLPVRFVVEDNGKSVCTDTRSVWWRPASSDLDRTLVYRYTLPWPHAGAGVRVEF